MADSNSSFPPVSSLHHKRRSWASASQSCSGVIERGSIRGRTALGHHFTLREIAQEWSAQSHGRTPADVYSCTYTLMAHREPPHDSFKGSMSKGQIHVFQSCDLFLPINDGHDPDSASVWLTYAAEPPGSARWPCRPPRPLHILKRAVHTLPYTGCHPV